MNYMEQVAEMLGVKLGEEFMIDCSYDKYAITFNGLYWMDKIKKKWIHTSDGLDDLLTGKVKIQKPILDEAERDTRCKYGQNFKDIKYELSRNYKLCKLNDKKTYEELLQILCEYILKSYDYEKALDNACELLEEYSSYDDPTPKDEWKERCLKDE